jgi:hypothetical protein
MLGALQRGSNLLQWFIALLLKSQYLSPGDTQYLTQLDMRSKQLV